MNLFRLPCKCFSFKPYLIKSNLLYIFKLPKRIYWRAKYGFCDIDIWELDNYLARLLSNSLNYMAINTTGYPGKYEHPELWERELFDLADNFNHISRWIEGDISIEGLTYAENRKELEKLKEESFKKLTDIYFDLWD